MVSAERLEALQAALRGAIPEGWHWEVTPTPPTVLRPTGVHAQFATSLRPDGELKLWDPLARPVSLQVEIKEHVSPSEVARLLPLYQYDRWLIAAPVIGPRTREVLKSAKINWLQFDGECRISVDSLYVERTRTGRGKSRPDTRSARRYVANLFAGASLRVVRWLLVEPSRSWSVLEMKRRATASVGFVSRAFATLERDAYVVREPGGIQVRDFDALLKAWSDAPSPPENRLEMISLLSTPRRILDALKAKGTPTQYALTAEGAADQIAPFARFSRLEMYTTEIAPWERTLELQRVDRGANVILIQPTDLGVFDGSRTVDGLRIVSSPQLYVDLKRRGGAAAEAAEHLRGKETGSR